MGFRIEIDRHDLRILQLLRRAPAEVFGRPYAGYLLLLIGGSDSAAIEWIRSNIVNIDSLTGDYIAFATFARKMPVRLRTRGPRASAGARTVGSASIDKMLSGSHVQKLAKSGELGRIADGDTIDAMTYAVDDIAMSLGVTSELPCMVIIDSLPKESLCVVRLDEHALSKMVGIVRQVMHDINKDRRFQVHMATIEDLARTESRMALISEQIEELRRTRDGADGDFTTQAALLFDRIHAAIDSVDLGSLYDAAQRLESLGLSRDSFFGPSAEDRRLFTECANTSATLAGFLAAHWPLRSSERTKYIGFCDRNVRRFLPDMDVLPDPDDRAQCEELCVRIDGVLADAVARMRASLPADDEFVAIVRDHCADVRKRSAAALADVEGELLNLKKHRDIVLRECMSAEQPSLSHVFIEHAKAQRVAIAWRKIQDAATALTREFFTPSTLLEFLKTTHGG